MGLLDGIASPEDLRRLPDEDLPALAEEVREFLVRQVSATGGHLGPMSSSGIPGTRPMCTR